MPRTIETQNVGTKILSVKFRVRPTVVFRINMKKSEYNNKIYRTDNKKPSHNLEVLFEKPQYEKRIKFAGEKGKVPT